MALLLGSGAVTPVAAAEVAISIDAPDEAAPDSDFMANVVISGVTNFDACQYDVTFNASVLRLDNVTSGLIGSTTIPIDIYNEITPGTYRVIQNIPDFPRVSGSGYLTVLHFHVIASEGDSSTISLSNGVLSDNTASEITATWVGYSVKVAAVAAEDTTPPTVVDSAAEDTTPPTAVSSPPEATAPNKAAPLPTKPINWPMLWGVIGGVIVVGLIIFLLARRKAY